MGSDKVLANAVKTTNGVELNGLVILPVIGKCEGCDRIRMFEDKPYCGSYPNPERKWVGGRCNFATHVKVDAKSQAKVNPLKASKRSAKGR